MEKVSKGVRVIYKGGKAKVIITSSSNGYGYCKVLLTDEKRTTWVSPHDLELDKEFYRHKKINRILRKK